MYNKILRSMKKIAKIFLQLYFITSTNNANKTSQQLREVGRFGP